MSTQHIANEAQKPHFVLVPFMAQGHMIPMVDIARLLSDRNIQVSFITTPVNSTRIKPALHGNHLISIVELTFPCKDFGLPEGCENIDLIPFHLYQAFFHAATSLAPQLKLYIQNASPPVTCIITDFSNFFTAEVGKALNIPRIIFHGPSCMCIHSIHSMHVHNSLDNAGEFDAVIVPDLPKKIEVTKAQAPGWFEIPGWERIREEAMEAEESASGIVVNTFCELESEIIDRYEKLRGKRVWPIGPLCLYDKDVDGMSNRGKKSSVDGGYVLNWLEHKEAGSVVYVSFGSLVCMKTRQVIEIGLGLERSNVPFIWVIKEAERSEEFDEWMREGFEERVKGRGLVITGWAPQVVVLSHGSVGGFMTHCGWNSVLEGVCFGVPMLTWPHFADQFLNEKLIVEVIEIGVAVGVDKPSHLMGDEELVKSEAVEKAVLRLMDRGEEGSDRRARAAEFGEKARKATGEGGSSWKNMNLFVEYITQGVQNGY